MTKVYMILDEIIQSGEGLVTKRSIQVLQGLPYCIGRSEGK